MSITTTGVLSPAVQQTFNLKLLAVPTPNNIHRIPAMKQMMPRHGGFDMRFRRYNPLNTFLVPLGNSGVTPPSQNLTAIDLDCKIDWYGTWLEINEQVILQNQEQVLNEAAIRLGVALRQTEDELTRNVLASTMTQIDCVNGSNGDNPTNLTLADINNVIRILLGNNGRMFLSSISGDLKFGTSPVRNAYLAMVHTDMTASLSSIQGFIHQSAYPNQERVLDSEWGAVSNIRYLVSSIGSTSPNASANGRTVYNNIVVAQEGFACVEQTGATNQFIYRPAVYSDALAQNVTIAAKFADVTRITNDQWVLNNRSTI